MKGFEIQVEQYMRGYSKASRNWRSGDSVRKKEVVGVLPKAW